jgi:hypothetical protein
MKTLRRILLCRIGVRRHRSEIMFSVLIIILHSDHVAGLGLAWASARRAGWTQTVERTDAAVKAIGLQG